MYAAVKYSVVDIFVLVQNLMEKIDDKLYKIHNHLDVHCPVVLDLSAHIAALDGDGVLVEDLGDVGEPRDDVEEGEELPIGDRIESEQTFFSV